MSKLQIVVPYGPNGSYTRDATLEDVQGLQRGIVELRQQLATVAEQRDALLAAARCILYTAELEPIEKKTLQAAIALAEPKEVTE